MNLDRERVGSDVERRRREGEIKPSRLVAGVGRRILAEGCVGGQVAGTDDFVAVQVDGGRVVVAQADEEIDKDRRVWDIDGRAIVSGGEFAIRIATKGYQRSLPVATVTELRWPALPSRVIE